MPRLALAIAYDGTQFDSYARQPRQRTVEGETVRLLQDRGLLPEASLARFRSGSRTDAGVSAAWNVVAFNTRAPVPAALAADARAPEGLHLLSAMRVPDAFEPRHARRRVYRYLLEAPWRWRRVSTLARRFVGEHDFSNFRRADEGKSPIARLTAIRYRAAAPGPWIEFEAPGFLWHQVRRIVAALEAVHGGEKNAAEVGRALDEPERRADLGLAPAENLLLVRVDYAGVAFPPVPRANAARLEAATAATRRRLRWLDATRGQGPTTRR